MQQADLTPPAVAALRETLLAYIPDDTATSSLARPPVLDQVMLAASSQRGVAVLYNDTFPSNTAGNRFNSTDQLFEFLLAQSGGPALVVEGSGGAQGAALATSTPAAAAPPADASAAPPAGASAATTPAATTAPSATFTPVASTTGIPATRANSSAARRLLRSDLELVRSAGGHARGLSIDFQIMQSAIDAIAGSARTLNLQFNVLVPTKDSANALSKVFLAMQGSGSGGGMLLRALQGSSGADLLAGFQSSLTSAHNASAFAPGLSVNISGVQVATLTYTRSFLSILLDFLYRNVLNVLAGTCFLILVVLTLSCYRECSRRMAARRAARKKAALAASLAGILSPIKRARAAQRWRRALLRVRIVVFLVKTLRELQLRREDLSAMSRLRRDMLAASGGAGLSAGASSSVPPPLPASMPAPFPSHSAALRSLSPGKDRWGLAARAHLGMAKAAAAALLGPGARAVSVKRGNGASALPLRLASIAGRAQAESVLQRADRRPSVFAAGLSLGGAGESGSVSVRQGGGSSVRGGGSSVSPSLAGASQRGNGRDSPSPAPSISPSQRSTRSVSAYATSPGISPALQPPTNAREGGGRGAPITLVRNRRGGSPIPLTRI